MQLRERKPKDLKKLSGSLTDYARYSNLGFQMLAILLAGVFGGIKLDRLTKTNFPVFTVVLSFLAIVAATYIGVKDFLNLKKKKNEK